MKQALLFLLWSSLSHSQINSLTHSLTHTHTQLFHAYIFIIRNAPLTSITHPFIKNQDWLIVINSSLGMNFKAL